MRDGDFYFSLTEDFGLMVDGLAPQKIGRQEGQRVKGKTAGPSNNSNDRPEQSEQAYLNGKLKGKV
jgi:hypothetical protein